VTLAIDNLHRRPHRWAELALDQDDQAIAAILYTRATPGNSVFVWGYRPGIYADAHLDSPTLFWDSQPLTGVPADRHLTSSKSIDAAWAQHNRLQFSTTNPTFIVDSLSQFNPALAMNRYPELSSMLARYRECARSPLSTVYCEIDDK
jgi:hypothetical protein